MGDDIVQRCRNHTGTAWKNEEEAAAEIERLRGALESLTRACDTAGRMCVDGHNRLYNVSGGVAAKRTFTDLKLMLKMMAEEAMQALDGSRPGGEGDGL